MGTSADYDEMAALVITVNDARGEEVQISSTAFEVRSAQNLFTEFGFTVGGNYGMVVKDVMMVPDGNRIRISTPYVLNARQLAATFRTNGSRVFVGDREQVRQRVLDELHRRFPEYAFVAIIDSDVSD